MARLRPSFAPLNSSSLRGLSGPTSPTSPISPRIALHLPNLLSPRAKTTNIFSLSKQISVEPPSIPMPWTWSCHRCHTRYLLGATRRCLNDGHYFCGGTTVDKISGKLKKHKACVSEFDYSGWEEFGRWKRAAIGETVSRGGKHCEDKCNFPSSCHWQGHHTIQEIESAYIDRSCRDKQPEALAVPRKTGNRIGKARKGGEKRTTQARAVLPPIAGEDPKVPSFTDKIPNGLSLHNPVMEFLSSEIEADENCQAGRKPQTNLLMPEIPPMSARIDNVWDDDVEMTNWITQDATEDRPRSPCAQPEASEVPFDFRLNQDEAERVSPVSPMNSTWNWAADGIGIALSLPDLPGGEGKWVEVVEEEIDELEMA